MEVGGRWCSEAVDLNETLARFKSGVAPFLLRRSVEMAFFNRWTAILAVAAHSAFAASLVEPCMASCHGLNGVAPTLASLFDYEMHLECPAVSRLPLRG